MVQRGDVQVKWTSDSTAYERDLNKVLHKQDQSIRKLREQARASRRASRSVSRDTRNMSNGFADMARQVGAVATTLGGLAVGGARALMQGGQQVREATASRLMSQEQSRAAFVQLSSDPKNVTQLQRFSDLLRSQGGLTADEAQAVAYQGFVAGASPQETLKLAQASPTVSTLQMLQVGSKIAQSPVGGGSLTGTIGRAMRASTATDLSPSEFITNVVDTISAGSAGQLTEDQLFSIYAAITKGVGSPSEAATATSRLLETISTSEQFQNMNTVDALRYVAKQNLNAMQMKELFPNVRAAGGMRALQSNMGVFESTLSGLGAGGENLLQQAVDARRQDPTAYYSEMARRQKGTREVTEEKVLGSVQLMANALTEQLVEEAIQNPGALAPDQAGWLARARAKTQQVVLGAQGFVNYRANEADLLDFYRRTGQMPNESPGGAGFGLRDAVYNVTGQGASFEPGGQEKTLKRWQEAADKLNQASESQVARNPGE